MLVSKGYIRISVALQQSHPAVLGTFVDGHSVAADTGEYQRLSLFEQVIELDPKKGHAVVFFDKTSAIKIRD